MPEEPTRQEATALAVHRFLAAELSSANDDALHADWESIHADQWS